MRKLILGLILAELIVLATAAPVSAVGEQGQSIAGDQVRNNDCGPAESLSPLCTQVTRARETPSLRAMSAGEVYLRSAKSFCHC